VTQQAYHSQPSAQASYQNSRNEEYARWRRRDHANIEAMQNLVISRLSEEAGVEMPPNARHLISALQGAHGGGVVAFEEFERNYLTIGKQLQFTGTDDAIRSRVRDWLKALDSWQYAVGVCLFTIKPGGAVIGYRPDGTPIRKLTTFIDHLKPKTDDAVQRARLDSLWKENPGKALASQVAWLKGELPALGTKEESGGSGKDKTRQPLDQYEISHERRIESMAEKAAGEIDMRGGDGVEWVERLATNLYRLASSLKKTERARRDYTSLSIFDDEQAAPDTDARERDASATAYTCKKTDESACAPEACGDPPPGGQLGKDFPTQLKPEEPSAQGFSEPQKEENADSMMIWALFWAVEAGIPVFPVHSVHDGICTCSCNKHCKGDDHKCGSECESKGKHPISRLVPNGSRNATTDPEIIKRWWRADPYANIGGRMGGERRLLGVDVDPRAGGDASFYDLTETHGSEWADTLRNNSGGGGFHLFLTVPEGIEFRKAELAPGIDLKWNNGYVVLPPSVHVSGNSYEVVDPLPILPVPQWLVEELTRKADQPPAKVIDFQEQKERFAAGSSQEKFYEPGRNVGLFGVGFGRWVNGWAADQVELHAQLLESNALRCVPPLSETEVEKMSEHIARDYPRGILRSEAGGAA
jgi:hypothetical protein